MSELIIKFIIAMFSYSTTKLTSARVFITKNRGKRDSCSCSQIRPMRSMRSVRRVSGASCRCVVRTRTTNADSSLRRRRRSEFREFQDRHSGHCGEADERTSGNYGRTAILSGGGVHVRLYLHTCTHAYRTVITPRNGNGDQIGCRGYSTPWLGRVAT